MVIHRFFFAAVFSAVVISSAQDTSQTTDYEKFLNDQELGVRQEEESFRQYSTEVTKQFDAYSKEQERLFREYTGQIEKKWGKKESKISTKEVYVSYEPDFSSRRSINFENGSAVVEVLVTETEAKNTAAVRGKLKEEIARLAVAKGGTDPLEVKNHITPEQKPIVSGQLAKADGSPVTERNASQFAEETIKKAEVTQQLVTGKDGIKRVVIGVQMPLVPDHVKKRAAEFRENVRRESEHFGIDITLVYAIMHTESYFNPKARSPVPAFGLMQLVPKSGARDAFFFAHKKDSLVTGEFLFIPDNNIALGTAYLTKLLTVEFRGVKDPKSRIYCVISAYNTGPGNVAKAFTGKRNVNQALPKINDMTSEQVFAHLRTNLPFEETRSYVTKVSERMGLYNEWSK
ncbi:MAG: murein transglycosylase domain-containing protein [Bacteriovoracaceae bacterium]